MNASSQAYDNNTSPFFTPPPKLQIGESETSILINSLQEKHLEIISLQNQIKELQENLLEAKKNIDKLQNEINQMETTTKTLSIKIQNPATRSQRTCYEGSFNADPRPRIDIYGTQQAVGLASALTYSRKNTNYEQYKIEGLTRPFSSTKNILDNCRLKYSKEADKVILWVGENDSNIDLVLSELRKFLTINTKRTIIVLSSLNNKSVNVLKLNNEIERICVMFKNTYFVQIPLICKLPEICKRINMSIDSIDYECKFLNCKALKKIIFRNSSVKPISPKPKIGTIPYYFKKKQNETSCNETSRGNAYLQRGTIPFYFPFVEKKNIEKNKNETVSQKLFFRE